MANVSLGKAVLVLATETGSFITDLDNASAHTKKLEQAVDSVGKGLQGVGKSTKDFGSALTMSVTGPIAAVIGGLAALALGAAKTGDDIAKNAREAGLGAESYQELTFALGQVAKVSEEELVKGFASLTRVIGDASAGSKKHIAMLEALGFTQAEIKSGAIDTEDAFNRFTTAVQRAESPAQALTFAGDLLGDRVGRKLAGALRESGDEVDGLRQQFNDLGLGMSGEALAASEAFNDQMDVMKRQFGALGREIGAEVLPIIMDDLIPFLRDTGMPVLKTVAEAIGGVVKWFADLPAPVQGTIAVVTGLVAALGPVLVVVGTLITSIGSIVSAFSAVAPIVTAAGAAIAAIGAGPLLAIIGAIGAVVLAWKNWDAITEFISNVYTAAKEWLLDKLGGIFTTLKEKIDGVSGFFKGMYDAVVGNSYVPDMVDGIGAHFKRLDKEMTDKADKETKKTSEAFKKMATEITEKMGLTVFNLNRFGAVTLPTVTSRANEFRAALTGWIPPLQGTIVQTDIMERAQARWAEQIRATRDALQEQLSATIGLMPAMKDLQQRMVEAGDATAGQGGGGFLGRIRSLFGFFTDDAPGFLGGFSSLFGDVFRGLFGGGGGGGVLQGIVSTGLTSLGNLLFPGFGNLLASLAPIVMDGLAKLGKLFGDFFSWVWNGFKSIFGWLGGGGSTNQPGPPGHDPDNPEQLPERPRGMPPLGFPEFDLGTQGQYLNFGRGTLAMLHGWEKITPLGAERDTGAHTTIIEVDGRQLWKVVEQYQADALRGRRRLRAT